MTMYETCLLHSKADRQLRLVVGRALEPFEITMMQWLLLVTVKNGPNNGVRMRELAEQLDVTMPQVTALMNDLTDKKLVKQKINNNDRRSRKLSITSVGKKRLDDIEKACADVLDKWFVSVDRSSLEGYYATLSHMTQSADLEDD